MSGDRILWNRRPTGALDVGDIDEIVVHNCTVHIEQMDDRCWWIGIYMSDGSYWMGNFIADSRGRMRFSEQENAGIEWAHDATHEVAQRAEVADEWPELVAAPEGPHDHKGHSEEKCVRCGWVMGHQPLNCNNNDTPHVFPSQLAERDRLRAALVPLSISGTQADMAEFFAAIDEARNRYAVVVHGRWLDTEPPRATVIRSRDCWTWHDMCTTVGGGGVGGGGVGGVGGGAGGATQRRHGGQSAMYGRVVAVTPTAPIDHTHAESVHAVAVIRAKVARLRRAVAVWQLPRSDAGEASKTTKTTKKAGD